MCGIAGILDLQGKRAFDPRLLASMTDTLRHRGPDQGGQHLEAGVALGHRRLSVIDLANGQQPLVNEDASVVAVFDGEIYNFKALARELAQFGHHLPTHSDTEVIVHAWEQWGERCVERFRGMFAFAIWDRKQRTLFLARDRFGVKPLYYAVLEDGSLTFGSELKALLCHPGLRRELDPLAVEDYFAYGYVPEPRSIFRQARKLAPGHTLTVRQGAPLATPQRYWDVPFAPHIPRSEEAACAELIARLREAVRIRLVAEVPPGAFLSGGGDASAVVAMMTGCGGEAVNTCSIGFGDPQFDESADAASVAQRYHTRHHALRVEQDDFGLIDQLARLYDEPFADSSALPTYRLCQLARQHVTVALAGDGGDESLAGYQRYRTHVKEERLRSALPLAVRRPLFGLLGTAYPKADWAPRVLRAKSTFQALAHDSVAAYFHNVALIDDATRAHLFSPAMRRQLNGYHALEILRCHAAASPTADALSAVQYLDIKTHLPGAILTKVDRASMAHGLEVRSPMLDHHLIEWTSGLPPSLKLCGGEGKYLFKKALQPYLPEQILYRKKMGGSLPLASWLRGPLRQQLQQRLAGPVLAQCGLFDSACIAELVSQHLSGRRDHSAPLWSLLMFEAFLRQVLPHAPVVSATLQVATV